MYRLSAFTRHRCFVSYHHADEMEVSRFIDTFDHDHNVLISRGIGASMPGDVIKGASSEYIMSRIRELYLNDSTVTIVMVGRRTWSRQFVDWEVAASLRNTANSRRNGLLAVTLPSVANVDWRKLPPRVADNVNSGSGYARWWKYPTSPQVLANWVDMAFLARTTLAGAAKNGRRLFVRNLPTF